MRSYGTRLHLRRACLGSAMWTTSRLMGINLEICGAGCGQFSLAETYAHVEDVDSTVTLWSTHRTRDAHDVAN